MHFWKWKWTFHLCIGNVFHYNIHYMQEKHWNKVGRKTCKNGGIVGQEDYPTSVAVHTSLYYNHVPMPYILLVIVPIIYAKNERTNHIRKKCKYSCTRLKSSSMCMLISVWFYYYFNVHPYKVWIVKEILFKYYILKWMYIMISGFSSVHLTHAENQNLNKPQ